MGPRTRFARVLLVRGPLSRLQSWGSPPLAEVAPFWGEPPRSPAGCASARSVSRELLLNWSREFVFRTWERHCRPCLRLRIQHLLGRGGSSTSSILGASRRPGPEARSHAPRALGKHMLKGGKHGLLVRTSRLRGRRAFNVESDFLLENRLLRTQGQPVAPVDGDRSLPCLVPMLLD